MKNTMKRLALIVTLGFGSILIAHAQYTVTLLQPAGFTPSEGHGISGSKEIGWGTVGGSQYGHRQLV